METKQSQCHQGISGLKYFRKNIHTPPQARQWINSWRARLKDATPGTLANTIYRKGLTKGDGLRYRLIEEFDLYWTIISYNNTVLQDNITASVIHTFDFLHLNEIYSLKLRLCNFFLLKNCMFFLKLSASVLITYIVCGGNSVLLVKTRSKYWTLINIDWAEHHVLWGFGGGVAGRSAFEEEVGDQLPQQLHSSGCCDLGWWATKLK